MKKLQSYFIYKFESNYLRDNNYKVNTDLDQARKDGQVIRLGDSELLRAIRRLKGIEFNQEELSCLIEKKKKIKSLPDSIENREQLKKIDEQIDKILFVEEIVSISFSDSRHYKSIIDKGGIVINGRTYVRLLAGAGMTRRSTVMFCEKEFSQKLLQFLDNGRDETYKINPSKYNAYFALASSASIPVSVPNFVVIPDCEIKRMVAVDYMTENEEGVDPSIEEKEIEQVFNLFDGQGLISPQQSLLWSSEVEIDWIPSSWILRGPFLKGLLITFDFHEFAKRNHIDTIIDVYGNVHDVYKIDVIISASQFKLWGAYKSTEDYIRISQQNNYGWSISRFSPEVDKKNAFTTYQYLQNLNITTKEQIESICKKTVDWIAGVTGENWIYSVLYLLGEIREEDVDKDWFENLDPVVQVLLLESDMINEPYIRRYITRMINKRIRESYMGSLLIDANYQFMIGDPLAQTQFAFGLQPIGLLKNNEHYSSYWNKKGVKTVSAIRSPMTWRSENNILNLKDNDELKYWYKYIYSGIVFNIHGIDFMSMSGGDMDGDICLTTNQKEFIDCAFRNLPPPTYNRKSADKKFINQDELWMYDEKTFRSTIGLITNIGTNFFAMLGNFQEDSQEYQALINRIKICNCLQSQSIDKAKGIETMNLPKWWTSWTKIKDGMTEEEKQRRDYNNSILCEKRPYFFKYLYKTYQQKFLNHQENYDNYSFSKFGIYIKDLIKLENKTDHQQKIINNYYRFSPLLDSNCVMNNICHHMEEKIKEIRLVNRLAKINYKGLIKNYYFEDEKYEQMKNIYKEFRHYRKRKHEDDNIQFLAMLHKKARKISSNSNELGYMAILINPRFAFQVFSDELIGIFQEENKGKIIVPILKENGSIDYMGEKYELKEFIL